VGTSIREVRVGSMKNSCIHASVRDPRRQRLWGVSGLSYETVAETREKEREREREDSNFLKCFLCVQG
jgi:hypothetical protein